MSLTKVPKPTKLATVAATGALGLVLAACGGSPQPPVNVSTTSATLKGDARVDQGDTNASWWWQLATTEAGIGPANPTGSTSRCRGGPANLPVGDYKGLSCNVT